MKVIILKQCSAAVLLLSFMAQMLSSPFIVFDYYLNTEAYAKNCINKATPEMHCNGKCQMAGELKKQEEKDRRQPLEEGTYKILLSVSERSDFASVPFASPDLSVNTYPSFNDSRTQDVSLPVFHPPGLSSHFI